MSTFFPWYMPVPCVVYSNTFKLFNMSSSKHTEKFSTGLLDCFHDCRICCCGTFCTPCLYGENVAKLEEKGCTTPCCIYYWLSCFCLQGLVAGPTRKKIRTLHGLKERPCTDCCVHCWCPNCAACQEAREIAKKGIYATVPQGQNQSKDLTMPPSTAPMMK